MMVFHYTAAALIVFGAVFHSWRGEKLLITPTLAVDDPFIQRPMTQAITRFGWHAGTGYMLLTAIILILQGVPALLELLTGLLWLVLGIANLIMAKAKHPGGPLLSLIGILIIAGYAL